MTMNISLEQAQAMIERARAHAERIGGPMNIAVVDGGGHRFPRSGGFVPASSRRRVITMGRKGPTRGLRRSCPQPLPPAPGQGNSEIGRCVSCHDKNSPLK
jgi:hypothetical protein